MDGKIRPDKLGTGVHNSMAIIDIMPGAKIYRNEQGVSILFGVPPEIIKYLMMREIPLPDYIMLPDTVYKNGVVQNAVEFPLYYFLFVQGNFNRGRKLNIMGGRPELKNCRELLRLTLLGPSKEEYDMLARNDEERRRFEGLYRESRALSVKDADGQEIPIDGFTEFLPFSGDGVIQTEHFRLEHKGNNVYEVDGELIDINFSRPQLPPYDLNPNYTTMMPGKFGIDVLGGASGFAARNPCSGLVLNYNSDYMLIDCMPYLEHTLNARGISGRQIKSLFLTHIHDDHCNIFPLVQFNDRVQFVGTHEIFWMACRKLSLITGHEAVEFEDYFDFHELTPYEANEFHGITITPHYTVHSIPTIGATFRMRGAHGEHSIVFVGDNKALPEIKKMSEDGIVEPEKSDRLHKLYRDHFDIFFADGGMGILHGDPRDSLESQAEKVVFLHLEKLPEEFDTTFSLAQHGKRYIIQEMGREAYLIKLHRMLNRHYPGMSEDWISAMLSSIHLVEYNAGDVIMKQGQPTNGMIYMILSGNVSILRHDGHSLREVSVEEPGDFLGEMAVVNRVEKRNASAVARTPVMMAEVHESLFYAFLQSEKRIDMMKHMWNIREQLARLHPFSGFSELVNQRLARHGVPVDIRPGEVLIEQGAVGSDVYIILKGQIAVLRDGMQVNVVGPGQILGEYGSLSDSLRNATLRSLYDGVVLRLHKDQIAEIIKSTPALNFWVHQVMRERGELAPGETVVVQTGKGNTSTSGIRF